MSETKDASATDKTSNLMLKAFGKLSIKNKLISIGVLAVVLILLVGVIIPLVFSRPQTKYFASSDLKSAVNIQNLAVSDYVYRGIAEKEGSFLWNKTVDYRVRYLAHIKAEYDMSKIEFSIDEKKKTIDVLLPEPTLSPPVLDDTKFNYLPESAKADISEVLALCKADAEAELNTEEIKSKARPNIEDTIRALIYPLVDNNWTVQFSDIATEQKEAESNVA